jgi:hypothetical protein
MSKSISVSALMLLCLAIALGCAQGKTDLLAPQTTESNHAISNSAQTHLWGYYNIYIDPDTRTATAICCRSAQFALNLVTFLNSGPGNITLDLKGITTGSGFIDVDLDIGIRHPVPDLTAYNCYDVRGIFIGDGSVSMGYDTDLIYSTGPPASQIMYDYGLTASDPYPASVGMPDGYTRWWNPSEFPNSGMFGYTPGGLSTPSYFGTATLGPYKYYADGLSVEKDLWEFLASTTANGVFSAGSTNTRNYYLRFPSGTALKCSIAFVANWVSPTTHPANAPEAVGLNVNVTPGVYYTDENNNGGNLILDVSVFDWDSSTIGGVMQDYRLIIESTVLDWPYYASGADMTPTESGPDYYTYHLDIPADSVGGPDGNEFWVIVQCADEDYTNPFDVPNLAGTDRLAACFRYSLPVSSCPCAPPDNLLSMVFGIVGAYSTVMDDVSVSFKSFVSDSSMQNDLDDIVDAIAYVDWGPPLAIFRIDSFTIPDAPTLEIYRQQCKDYIVDYISSCDSLYLVHWIPDPASGNDPFDTLAVVSPGGEVRYEPILDTEVTAVREPPPTHKEIEGVQGERWTNLLGITKASVEISIQALGSDGCQAQFQGSFISSSGFPTVIEPANSSPAPLIWCYPKYECFCRAMPGILNLEECATVTQSYNYIVRIGIDPFSADLRTTGSTIQAWACADGDCGAGPGQ